VTARLIPVEKADVAAWSDLAANAAEPNPFFEPAYVLAAARAFGRGITLLVADDWSGVLPVRRPVPGVLRTWCHSYCFLGTPLVRDAAGARALMTTGRVLVLDRQRGEGPVAEWIGGAARDRGLTTFYRAGYERAALERREDGDYLSGLRAHHRREYKRQHRRLEEELGAPLEVADVSADPAAVDRFMALEQSGWKGRAGTALSSRPPHAKFFREVCAGFRDEGRLQMLEMTAGGRVVAMKCNFAGGDGVFCFKIAHDETLARFSPGVQLEIAHVDRFHEDRRERWADSCAAHNNDMINRLWPDSRRIETLALTRPGPHALLLGHAARAYKTRSAPSPAS
jgi:CelD/BcsL family acetyltransferase involved in cellulose biosynthesis